MKALILSFFAVILGYSLIFDEKKTTDQPVIKDSNSVYVDRPANMQMSDSIMIYIIMESDRIRSVSFS